ncbi:MAG: ABC transporter ATP-binding protein [Candidatus Dactylopiibacterium carminicum]|uniref:ABC transporter ATP-binding protein n=1 Tax=Candidatus Dactylopiibacterium carminicum TaxID=857335 RepID=A0A272EVN5_9RHOO|nr:ABC transporter ATP-binding protein [Candidatus Dactylopiibacterium carminicum]KAF7599888.1 ABC transporter ATP-binding protein [Candidatus Dactylopiibacterium carminicum]PAS94173.1 MAG: ABC transporter ATP-binding protein [Candidatus Dactylopiibacterium carminicum]PAS96755.1 MAG: ABC transporter ATP-binding protein [Candidatus Dactylopiibacterium carminicum]PAS99889.1 MAG: ABC transporter ATP-binding protein [Candidatus Dactylopiibacterium carminicum]
MASIELKDIVKIYKDRKRGTELLSIDNVSFSVDSNEFLCLLGPSGCGKSTLLNMIAGFESATSGTVSVGGKPVLGPGADRGMVFQQATLMPWLPVWENIAFSLKLAGKGAEERRAAAQPFIDMVKLTGFENHYPAELSGGMAQRVGIARALLLNFSVILMDEPFAALDAQTKLEMQEELVAIWQRHQGTVVFVTHSVDEALVLGSQIAVMTHRPGRIRELIKLDLPRPRDSTSAEFNEYKRHILALIREESALARADAATV